MANSGNEKVYGDKSKADGHLSEAFQVGLIAATSAVVGGLAVAWWHRKTLSKLNNPVNEINLQNTVESGADSEE